MNTTGEAIAYFRGQRKISQGELAKTLNITRPMLSHIETGKVDPTFDMIRKIAIALDVTAPEIDKRK